MTSQMERVRSIRLHVLLLGVYDLITPDMTDEESEKVAQIMAQVVRSCKVERHKT